MRSLNLNQEILNFYLIDDFNTEDKNIIVKELENRLSNIKNLELEIGSGNGKFIVELAMNNKDKYFVGIEYSFKAAKKAISKAYKRDIKNLTIIKQSNEGTFKVYNQYKRAVSKEGNVKAQNLVKKYFRVCDFEFRGLGLIEKGGLELKEEFSAYDASKKLDCTVQSKNMYLVKIGE